MKEWPSEGYATNLADLYNPTQQLLDSLEVNFLLVTLLKKDLEVHAQEYISQLKAGYFPTDLAYKYFAHYYQ